MIKSKELSDPNSCLNKCKDNEPVFVLCARDRLAPVVIRWWVSSCRLFNLQPEEKLEEAERLVDSMIRWRTDHLRSLKEEDYPPDGKVLPERARLAMAWLRTKTHLVHYSPNCAKAYCLRLLGKNKAMLDNLPRGSTDDRLYYGDTLEEAAAAAHAAADLI